MSRDQIQGWVRTKYKTNKKVRGGRADWGGEGDERYGT